MAGLKKNLIKTGKMFILMIDVDLIEEDVVNFVKEKYPDSVGKLELIIKEAGFNVNIDQENIKRNVQMIDAAFFQPFNLLYFNRLYGLIKQFATAFDDKKALSRLLNIRKGISKENKKGLPIPNVEETLLRSYSEQNKPVFGQKSYSAGNLKYSRGDLYLIYQESILAIMGVFWEIYNKNNLSIPFEFKFNKESDSALGV